MGRRYARGITRNTRSTRGTRIRILVPLVLLVFLPSLEGDVTVLFRGILIALRIQHAQCSY
jgi:hypothetical protein